MEYFPCGDLGRYINQIETENEVRQITTDLLEGLRIMHAEGFTHRDLKPQNIFVVQMPPHPSTWWVKIGDFGIAKRVQNEQTALRTSIGTPCFQAPEISGFVDALDGAEYDNKVDIWSLGCVVYNLCAKRVPFPKSQTLRKFCSGKIGFPEDELSERLSASGLEFVKLLLKPIPSDRLSAELGLSNDWLQSTSDLEPNILITAITPEGNSGSEFSLNSDSVSVTGNPPPSATAIPGTDDENPLSPVSTQRQDIETVAQAESKEGQKDKAFESLDGSLFGFGHKPRVFMQANPFTARERKFFEPNDGDSTISQQDRRKMLPAPVPPLSFTEKHEFKQLEEAGFLIPRIEIDQRMRQKAFCWAASRGLRQVVSRLLADDIWLLHGRVQPVLEQLQNPEMTFNKSSSHIRQLLTPEVAKLQAGLGGSTALHMAVVYEEENITRILLREGADVGAANNYGYTPLQLAARGGNLAIFALFLQIFDLVPTLCGEMMLIAAACGYEDLVELLLTNSTRADFDKFETTALHLAATRGHEKVVEILLNSGADVNREDGTGSTAYDLAYSRGHYKIARLLREHTSLGNALAMI